MTTGLVLGLLSFFLWAVPLAAAPLEWPMDSPLEITQFINLDNVRFSDGLMSGQCAWDPHFYVRLPAGGISAQEFTWLETRLYSSAPADLLDIYYHNAEGYWCLGGKFPIAQGWAVYRVDLTKNVWRETRTGEASRRWGGPSGRVVGFRLDPGNEANRWIIVDYVKLMPPPEGAPEGVTPEPQGVLRGLKIQAPPRGQAGRPLAVAVELQGEIPPSLTQLRTFLRLRQGQAVYWAQEQSQQAAAGIRWQAQIPVSRYWRPGLYELEAGAYELAPISSLLSSRQPVQIDNPRLNTIQPARVQLQRRGGDAAIFVNGKPLAGLAGCFHSGDLLRLHQEFAQAGVHLFSDWFGTSISSDLGHIAPDVYDYSLFDRYFTQILDIDPQAYFLPHIGVVAPLWWQKLHPEELTVYADGKKGPPSFASPLWRERSGEDLRRLLSYLQRAPYADRIIGIIFYGGYTAEWQMWGTWQEHRDDYSAPALRAFRAFLRERYRTEAALQQAWKDPNVTFATAEAPDWTKRHPEGPQLLRTPETERQAMDYYDFISNMTADALLHFAQICREETQGRWLVGTYYAYLSAHGALQVDSGHNAVRRVFDSPYIDFLMSPPNYDFRRPGETSTFMSATDSLRLRGKLWLNEADNRTFLSDPSAGYGRADTLEETLGVLWRELSLCLTKRAALSYYDMDGGWYSHPEILKALSLAQEIMNKSLQERRPFAPEVCLLVDPASFTYLRPKEAVAYLVRQPLVHMPQTGVPFDYCLLEDIGEPWLPDYKFYIFLNAVHISAPQREKIVQKLRRNHATALFVYAPGYFQGASGSVDYMQQITGLRLGMLQEARPIQLVWESSPPPPGLNPHEPFGANVSVSPVFYVQDPQAEVLARLTKSPYAGLVRKKQDGWTAIYSAALNLPPAVLRHLMRQAGVHIWIDSEEALYTDGHYIGLHAASPGEKTLWLPRPGRLVDMFTGQPIPVEGRCARLKMQKAETRLLQFF